MTSAHASARFFLAAMSLLLILVGCGGSTAPAAESLPFTARSWPVAADAVCPRGSSGSSINGLQRITAVDEHTITFHLCAPDVAFLQKISLQPFQIDDSGYLKAHAQDGTLSVKPNGTGPFQLTSWERESQIVLSRFNGYWGEKAQAKSLVFQWQTDSAAKTLELESGVADGIDNVAPTDIERISANPEFTVYPRDGLSIMYMGFNNNYAPFSDLRVRKALAMSLDRQRIIDTFYPKGSSVATHFTPCAINYACGGKDWYEQDTATARQLLAEAGYPNGFSTTLSYRDVVRRHTPNPTAIAVDVQSQLAAIGINAKLDLQESSTFQKNRDSGKISGLFLAGFGADYLDPTDFMDYFFGPGRGVLFGTLPPGLSNLVSQASVTADGAKRTALYTQANEIIRDQVVNVPIAFGSSAVAFRSDVQGAAASSLGNEYFATMKPGDRNQLVFIQNIEPPGLYCADEADFEAYRVCSQINETLYGLVPGKTELRPLLATNCSPSSDAMTWTCMLRKGVKFQNGATFDAGDVLDSFAAIWDCAHPYHKGRAGTFVFWGILSNFLNEESCASH